MTVTPEMIEAFHKAYDASLEMQPRETSQAIYDGLSAALQSAADTPAPQYQVLGIKLPLPSWKEQAAFEEWANANRYEMAQHPLHYLFMDKETNAARQGWKAALEFVRAALAATATEGK